MKAWDYRRDKTKDSSVILSEKLSGIDVDRRRVDISGEDTKDSRFVSQTHKVFRGVRGGLYVIKKGVKRYIK